MLVIFFATFGAVFIAEIVGDKLLYTTGVLAARYRTAPIMIGMIAAFMAKMGVAVLIGEVIARLPRLLVAAITAASFVGVAIALWRKDDEYRHERDQHKAHKAAMISFAAIFFSAWAAVAAMVTKGSLAAFLGSGIRRWIQDRVSPGVVRYVGVSLLLFLGVLSVWEILSEKV